MSTILLVVDDEPDVQLLVKQKFRRQIRDGKYTFIFAANGVDALEKLKHNPDVDVVLCDVNMPQMDGITLLSKTRKVSQTVQTIIVSAYGDMRNIRRAMNHGAFDFVTKPINFNDLGATIDKTIQHVRQLKEAISEKEKLYRQLERHSEMLEETVEQRTAEIEAQKRVIEIKNQHIIESINYAKRIQESILPPSDTIQQILPESFILFQPKDIVSGDFYWMHQTDKGQILITAVDCTGHGVPGAFMSLIGNDLLNLIVKAKNITEPEHILEELHRGVRHVLNQENGKSRDGMDLSFCSIDLTNKQMHFAGARNPLVIVREGNMEIIKGDKKSVGGTRSDDTLTFTRHTISLEKPAMYYIFSDGYQDQFGGENGQKYLTKNFRKLLLAIHHLPIPEQEQILTQELSDWRGSYPQVDDILVIGMRL
ncbi:MAG: response regulator [Bernardetiaceae bacterium]